MYDERNERVAAHLTLAMSSDQADTALNAVQETPDDAVASLQRLHEIYMANPTDVRAIKRMKKQFHDINHKGITM